jgi:hypothetical protein
MDVPDFGDVFRALRDAFTYRGPQPEFRCPFCGRTERSGHPCPPLATNIDAQRRLIKGLDDFARGK